MPEPSLYDGRRFADHKRVPEGRESGGDTCADTGEPGERFPDTARETAEAFLGAV